VPRTPRICGEPVQPKCLNPAVRNSRCNDHQPTPFAGARERWLAQRPKHYNRLRQRVIREAKGLCEKCGSPGSEVDHKVPVAEGGSWARENLWLLCELCHETKSKKERRKR
jgi:5-methylcytosine-specific restriction enzyme A